METTRNSSTPRAELVERASLEASRDGPLSAMAPTAGFIGLLLLLAWGYLGWMDWGMKNMDQALDMWIMPRMAGWQAYDVALVFLMWTVMMAAMMLPSALPVFMLLASVGTVLKTRRYGIGLTGAFVTGYLVTWCAFSLAATLLQWGLLEAALITPMMESASLALSSTILSAAGIYQFTPLKNVCLRECKSPLGIVMQATAGPTRALVAGLRHGLYCLGCCWALMTVLFATGVMNMLWIVLLATYVLIEKTMPGQRWIAPAAGAMLIAWSVGLWFL